MERIGLYGGSFDPIHYGHLNLALEILEKCRLTKIYFCPAALSPHKLASIPASSEHRMAMLKLAIEEVPQFSILESELSRSGPSYTIDTVEELLTRKEDKEYYLIIGADAAIHFSRWHRASELTSLIPILVGSRAGSPTLQFDEPGLELAISKGLVETHLFDISSSEIRERLKADKYCGFLMPPKVLDYIYKYRLYSSQCIPNAFQN